MSSIFPLRLIKDKTKINFMDMRKIVLLVSVIAVVASILLVFTKGLNFGIDFSGGILIEAEFEQNVDAHDLRIVLNSMDLGEVKLQSLGSSKSFSIRLPASESADQAELTGRIKSKLTEFFDGKIDYRKIDYVGPQVGSDLIKSGIMAMIISLLGIMAYVALRFEWQYGVGVVAALLHDVVLTIGFMSLVGLEFDLTSIAAILTVVGYSVNDSVVIYDRIRENIKKYKKMIITDLLDLSINETLSRTILTVLTTLISALALIIFGGDALFSFSTTVFVGIAIGTYSSIYISAPILSYLNIRNKATSSER